jgi:hypothetical protein
VPEGKTPYVRIVGKNWRRTVGYVVASSGLCRTVQEKYVSSIDRNVVGHSLHDLDFEPAQSWIMAVIVCPGDDLSGVTKWAMNNGAMNLDRMVFFFAKGVDVVKALQPWHSEGLADPYTSEFEDYKDFTKQFGRALNDRVFTDFADGGT